MRMSFLAMMNESDRELITNRTRTSARAALAGARPGGRGAISSPRSAPIADEITAAIAEAIPEYRQPMGGAFGRGVRDAIEETLRQFLAQLGRPAAASARGATVYVALGRGEFRAGRRLDALQDAYRVGARVAWRRISEARDRRRARGADAGAARRVDLRLHRRDLGRVGRGLRERAGGERRRALARAPGARATARRRRASTRRRRGRRGGRGLGAAAARWRRSPPTIATPSASRDRRRGRDRRRASTSSSACWSATPTPRASSSGFAARARGPARRARPDRAWSARPAESWARAACAASARARRRAAARPAARAPREQLGALALHADPERSCASSRRSGSRRSTGCTPVARDAPRGDAAGLAAPAGQRAGCRCRATRPSADGALPARRACASCFGATLEDPDARFELELALRGRPWIQAM